EEEEAEGSGGEEDEEDRVEEVQGKGEQEGAAKEATRQADAAERRTQKGDVDGAETAERADEGGGDKTGGSSSA
ncbi:hypothetical protein V493_04241, partial [Pseudogymnoascus sp. VKM F-4281 (FW-2241)]